MSNFSLTLAKTLYQNIYRCAVKGGDGAVKGFLRVIPGLPLDRGQIPADAPDAPPFLLVIVDDADINNGNFLHFEDSVSMLLLERFAAEDFRPLYCQFYYPSPALTLNGENGQDLFDC
ncbi:MAG: hypothetical protein LBP78_05570 [Acidaminococcales bacterium]|jgi:hypothetical protein|nr:hypothetical protein [Acidaminococcales bacterium]